MLPDLCLLDLYCGAGGASMGYLRAGFSVVGVDIVPQRHYPAKFVQADALDYLAKHGHEFALVHASPPCQAYSDAWRIQARAHPRLIEPTRQVLQHLGCPYVIENVPGAPLQAPILLCGAMFGLQTYRHRLFESSMTLSAPAHPEHTQVQRKMGRPVRAGEFIQVVGHFSNVDLARSAMGISWMTRNELAEAIPPAYTEYLGHQLRRFLDAA